MQCLYCNHANHGVRPFVKTGLDNYPRWCLYIYNENMANSWDAFYRLFYYYGLDVELFYESCLVIILWVISTVEAMFATSLVASSGRIQTVATTKLERFLISLNP